jgi:hypothetical protein
MGSGKFNTSLIQEESRIANNNKPSVDTEGYKPKPTAYEKKFIGYYLFGFDFCFPGRLKDQKPFNIFIRN